LCVLWQAPNDELVAATMRIEHRLASERAATAVDLIQAGDLEGASEVLLNYYDRTYLHQEEQRRGRSPFDLERFDLERPLGEETDTEIAEILMDVYHRYQ
jgi:hypothetical protein